MRVSILLVLIITFISCRSALDFHQEKDKLIYMKRTSCYGECPVYEVTVYTDGTVKFIGEHFVPVEGAETFQLNNQDFARLKQLIKSAELNELEGKYHTERITDLPTTFITWYKGKQKKEIEDYTGAPKSLKTLENELQEMVFSYLK